MELGRVAQHDERFLDYQRRSRNLGSMYNVNASSKKKHIELSSALDPPQFAATQVTRSIHLPQAIAFCTQ
jgi:hypothetical protein